VEKPRRFEVLRPGGVDPWEEEDLAARADFQALAVASGHEFKNTAIQFVRKAGAEPVEVSFTVDRIPVDARIRGQTGAEFLLLARGTPDEKRKSGLRKDDTVQKVGFNAMQLRGRQDIPILVVTSDLPRRASKAGHYLAMLADVVWDVVAIRDDFRGFQRLLQTFDGTITAPPPAPWRDPETPSPPDDQLDLPLTTDREPDAQKDT